MEHKVLVLFAHPALEHSRVHVRMLRAPRGVEGVTLHDLYETYPQFDVDAAREQELLAEHDVIVFQHPLYWYSAPPLIRQWQDIVLEHGWAYGSSGTALEGKSTMHVISCGGGESSYRASGSNRFTIDELLRPYEQTARLCSMHWLPPLISYGTHAMTTDEIDEHVERYRSRLNELQSEGR